MAKHKVLLPLAVQGIYPNAMSVFYHRTEGINTDLDEAIEQAVKPYGYERYASGIDVTNGVRDLAFDKKE